MEIIKGLPNGLVLKSIVTDNVYAFDKKVNEFLENHVCYQVSFPSGPNQNGHSVGAMLFTAHILYVGSNQYVKDRDNNE
jgi:hypothetical protein